MRILFCGKWPPIQGGVCRESYEFVLSALSDNAVVTVVSNASAVEENFKMTDFHPEDVVKTELVDFPKQFKLINVSDISPLSHIPSGKIHLSQLMGSLDAQIKLQRPDVIVGSYLEPYGIAAMIVGRLNRLPTFVRHAGSDLGRLATFPELRDAYTLGLADRDLIKLLTYKRDETSVLLEKLGVEPDQMIYLDKRPFHFTSYHLPGLLDIDSLLHAADTWLCNLLLPNELVQKIRKINSKNYVQKGPVVGVFGKAHTEKGTFDLAQALKTLAEREENFTFLPMCTGHPHSLQTFFSIIANSAALAERTFVLPPVALWHVPSYIDRCDILAFLENHFSIGFHSPSVPWEVIHQGKPLLIAGEQYRNMNSKNAQLVDGKNCVLVEDPHDTKQMIDALSKLFNSDRLRSLSYGARNLKKIHSSRTSQIQSQAFHPMYAALKANIGT